MAAGKPLIIVLRMTFLTLPVFTVEIILCQRAGASSKGLCFSRRFEDSVHLSKSNTPATFLPDSNRYFYSIGLELNADDISN